jgi:hypothetical protein
MKVANPRPTKEQVDARVNELLRVMLDGAERWDLVDFVRQREKEEGSPWFISEGSDPLCYAQIRKYVGKAHKEIAKAGQGDRAELIRAHVAKRRNLYAKAVAMGDIRAALACADSECKLLGLFPEADSPSRAVMPTSLNVVEVVIKPGLETTVNEPHRITAHIPANNHKTAPCPASLSAE